MYDELIKALHEGAEFLECSTPGIKNSFAKMCHNAADAIEELTAYVRQIEELRKDGFYLQKTKMMTYGQATMTQPLPEPPKEA